MGRLTPREVEAAVTEVSVDDDKDFLSFLDDDNDPDPWWDEETFEDDLIDDLDDEDEDDEDDYYDPEWDEYMSDDDLA